MLITNNGRFLLKAARITTKKLPLYHKCSLSTIKFTPSHEYIKINGNIGTVGITDHAAGALGDVVFVDLPSIGAKFSAGDSFGSVESVKAASGFHLFFRKRLTESKRHKNKKC